MPSGTMSNQVALHAQTTPGDEIFLHAKAHIVENEQGGAAVLSGLQTRTFDSDDGTLDLELLEHYFHQDDDVHHPRTTLVAVENTHNYCGGVVYPLEKVRELRAFCDSHGMILHLDGARVCNAADRQRRVVARHRRPLRLGERLPFEGARRAGRLGAARQRGDDRPRPAGAQALRRRHAPGRHHRRRRPLRARSTTSSAWPTTIAAPGRSASAWRAVPGLTVDERKLQTNMVFADTHGVGLPAARVVELLDARGVLALDEAPWSVRFVTHLDLDDADVEEAGEIVAGVIERVVA